MTTTVPETAVVWNPAPAITPRGTVLLLPGRGEHPGVYARFGRRLAFDGYVVRALAGPEGLAALVAEARELNAPVVLAGSDTGALSALAEAELAAPDALLLVGVPGEAGDWTDELAVRTACPTHRGQLAEDPAFRAGDLARAVPAELAAAAADATPAVPVLLLHGAADPVAPADGARALAARLPRAELVLLTDGLHDVLNDAPHRTVAARIVHWLERLRLGADLPPLLTEVPTAQEGTRP